MSVCCTKKCNQNYIETQVFPSFDWRDKRWVNKLTIKTIVTCLMNDNANYLMISKCQTRTGYTDLAMIVRPQIIPLKRYSDPFLKIILKQKL